MKREFQSVEVRAASLVARHGYQWADGRLIRKGIRGYTSDEVLPGTFRSAFSAAEYLIPICGEEFHNDYTATFPEQ